MTASLESLDWRGFLARSPLLSPPVERLRSLCASPILVTGAGGSIGSALTLRLAELAPPLLLALDAAEGALYALQRRWAEAGLRCHWVSVLGSVGDNALLEEIFAAYSPRLVFHAAAFKHVPLIEEQPLAAIANNIFGTETLLNSAAAHGARVILLSTDKAVAPASAMGATKRAAEQIVLAGGGVALRLANVLGSQGSVAEVFARQIAAGSPVTLTDPAASRYFLTLDEAVNLLLWSAVQPKAPALLAPVLPGPHSICDLARFMIRVLAPGEEVAIECTDPRPGDKQSEQLWATGTPVTPAGCGGLVVVESPPPADAELRRLLRRLRTSVDARDVAAALDVFRTLVPDYTPSQELRLLARRSHPQVCP